MLEFHFQSIDPIPQLKGFVEKIWLFESKGRMPSDDLKLIVPNGRLLLILPVKNSILGEMKGEIHFVDNSRIALVGMCDSSSTVDASTENSIATIGMEINALGAYRFFHLRLKEIQNRIFYLSDILGEKVDALEQRMRETSANNDKVKLLQEFLWSLFVQQEQDSLFEYCVQRILAEKGGMMIKQLADYTNYSNRWLNLKFEERLGVSPKKFSSIIRFNKYYLALMRDSYGFFDKKEFYDFYYDESHFIKEFKRFAGMPPSKFANAKNEFGLMFYQD